MQRLLAGVGALAVVAALGSCAKTAPAPASTPTSQSTSQPASPTMTTTTTAAPGKVDQSSPEAALVSLVQAMAAGDATSVCGLLSTGGVVIGNDGDALEQCAAAAQPTMDQLKSASSQLRGLKVTGATITGNKATFEAAKVEPELLAGVITAFKAVQIDGKWYITQ